MMPVFVFVLGRNNWQEGSPSKGVRTGKQRSRWVGLCVWAGGEGGGEGGRVCVEKHKSDGTTEQNTPAHCKREPWWWAGPVTAAMSFLLMMFWEQTESLTFSADRNLGGDPGVTDSKSGISCIHFRQNTLLRNWRIEKIDAPSFLVHWTHCRGLILLFVNSCIRGNLLWKTNMNAVVNNMEVNVSTCVWIKFAGNGLSSPRLIN